MIELTPEAAMTLYLALLLGSIAITWCYSFFRKRKKTLDITDKELTTCEYCQLVYLSDKIQRYTECPQCKSINLGSLSSQERDSLK